jgi:hypothetical protein
VLVSLLLPSGQQEGEQHACEQERTEDDERQRPQCRAVTA